jgi:2-oxoglutarate ferredoxin oxidoreductase subunit alpha
VIAASTPADCFAVTLEAARIATAHMCPVIVLTDGYLANGSEPWKIPSVEELPEMKVQFRTDPEGFRPYSRNPETLARPWVRPGTPGLEHRIGGIEKDDGTGNVSYDPDNHQKMVHLRAQKIQSIQVPDLEVHGDPGELLVIGWGSTYGSIRAAVEQARAKGLKVAQAHFRHLNPLPKNTAEVLRSFKRVICPEMNMGQLAFVLRGHTLVDVQSISKVKGKAFMVSEILDAIQQNQ